MSEWKPIETAPEDRKIVGRNDIGEEAVIWRERVHPKVDVKFWCCASTKVNENWVENKTFYPVVWRDVPTGEPPHV